MDISKNCAIAAPSYTYVFPHSDTGNAYTLHDSVAGKIIYNVDNRQWYAWDETSAKWSSMAAVLHRVVESGLLMVRYAEAEKNGLIDRFSGENILKEEALKFAKKTGSTSRINATLAILRTMPKVAVRAKELDASPDLLGVVNGVIDLKSGELLENRPDYLITRYASANFVPDSYCPDFIKFVYQVCLFRKELVDFVQEMCGYLFSGYTKEQAIFLLHGLGANGKSTLTELLGWLLGPYSCGMPSSALIQSNSRAVRPELARLPGIRLANIVEFASDSKIDESLVKKISGGDTIAERAPWRNIVDFVPMVKVVLAVNTLPQITGVDNGIFRRLIVVPFDADFRDRVDKNLPEKLKSEADGILNWAVRGFLRYYERGGFTYPNCVVEACAAYRDMMDVVGAFLEEKTDPDIESRISIKDLYSAYSDWAKDSFFQVVGKQIFSNLLEQKGFKKVKSGKWLFEGLKWKNEQNDSFSIT